MPKAVGHPKTLNLSLNARSADVRAENTSGEGRASRSSGMTAAATIRLLSYPGTALAPPDTAANAPKSCVCFCNKSSAPV
jgi:hypothetical protein